VCETTNKLNLERLINTALTVFLAYSYLSINKSSSFISDDRDDGPPLCSSSHSSWLRVRFPALPDFLSSSRSGTGSTQPRGYN
jgi:hypothetical protein